MATAEIARWIFGANAEISIIRSGVWKMSLAGTTLTRDMDAGYRVLM